PKLAAIAVHARASPMAVTRAFGSNAEAHAIDRGDAVALDDACLLGRAIRRDADDEHPKRVATASRCAQAEPKHRTIVELTTHGARSAREILDRHGLHLDGLRLSTGPDPQLDLVAGFHLLQLTNETSVDDAIHVTFTGIGGRESQVHTVDGNETVSFLDAGLVGGSTCGHTRDEQAASMCAGARARSDTAR